MKRMTKKETKEETQTPISEGAEDNEALTTIRELLTTAPDNRAKMYVELQLEDYDNAANDSQRAKVLSNLRAGLKNRAENDFRLRNLQRCNPSTHSVSRPNARSPYSSRT